MNEPWTRIGPPARQPSTVVEWIIGVSLLAILLAVSLPRISHTLDARVASEALDQIADVRQAVQRAAEQGDWAAMADTPEGRVPDGLAPYLPEGVTFDDPRWTLDWDLFELRGSLRTLVVGDRHGSLTIRLRRGGVADAVERLAGQRIWLRLDNEISFLVPTLGPGVE